MTTNKYRTLPVFPLRGNVAFPSITYRDEEIKGMSMYAFADALGTGGEVLLLTQTDITAEDPSSEDFYRIGTIARAKRVVQNPDGSRSVVFECTDRAEVEEMSRAQGFFRAKVNVLPEITVQPSPELDAAMLAMRERLREVEELRSTFTHELFLAATSLGHPGQLADFVANIVLSDFRQKQEILSIALPVVRLERMISLLDGELEIMRAESAVEGRVREQMEDSHREYYLREQMKAIRRELGEDDDEDAEYEARISEAHLPQNVEDKLRKELARMMKTPIGSSEATVIRNYLDICLDIPWSKTAAKPISVTRAAKLLDEDHDGLKKVKERILEYIAVQQIAPRVKGQILCLIGPPGVGKTSVALSVARAMNRPCARISLGGVRDEADIRGHRKTYVGSMPGRIVNALIDAQVMNPVLILDEIDKLSSSLQGDPASALLEALDPEQNKEFRDHFIEIPIDLSGCVFIATANYYEGIPAPLLDRMEVIELSSYTETEKYNIAVHHLLPKQLKNHGLTKRNLKISDDAMYEIIHHYTREAGVRNLEREIAALCRKTARKIAEGTVKSISVTPKNLVELLGNPKVLDELPEETDPVGVVNGLAYTSAGGALLKVEAVFMSGNGKIELTGSLGDVMKESAHIAVSYVRSVCDTLHIDRDFYKKYDLHIHFPEGATPKDGPSAGVSMTCAIVSALTGTPVRRDVAMTGEITLRGKVLPIGGLKEKTAAAYRSGIKTVLIPRENRRDLDDIDPEIREKLNFIFCDTIPDVLSAALRHDIDTPIVSEEKVIPAPVILPTSQTPNVGAHI